MPRKEREKSSSGIYHIMLRGINKQDIFNDQEDRLRFTTILEKNKEQSGYELYGYCLMHNHVHLLLKEVDEKIAQAMKRIGASYVYWYNKKHQRCGHLFQDRFKSEKVEDDRYLLVALRYIHQNPLKAGLVKDLGEYRWSSYNDYLSQGSTLTSTKFVMSLFDPNPEYFLGAFKKFMSQEVQDKCLDFDDSVIKSLSDDQVIIMLKDNIGVDDPLLLKNMDKKTRDNCIRRLRGDGVTIMQLSRLSGLGRGIIEKATCEGNRPSNTL